MTEYFEYFFPSSDGKTMIHVNCWVPKDRPVRGVVQIAHGVAEYAKRYDPFARYLSENGFAVAANDHLGHGRSQIKNAPWRYFGEEDGWWHVVDDIEELRRRTAEEFPNVPYFLFGHSMGSFLSRSHLMRYPGRVDGCILCGTGHPSALTITAGKLAADHEIKKYGKDGYSAKAESLAFGSYNKKFAPNRTSSDWVSASEENVDAYLADMFCGGEVTVGLLRDILEGLEFITSRKNAEKMDRGMPVLFVSGEDDPVGDMGKGVSRACRLFKKTGMKDVEMKLYAGLRHEILNEDTRLIVYKDVLHWLEHHI